MTVRKEAEELLRLQREQDAISRAEAARKILDNPEIKSAWEAIETAIVGDLAANYLDGSQAKNEYALELVRVLQANQRHKRLFELYVTTGDLVERQAALRPQGVAH